MITEGEAAIPLETTRRVFCNQEKSNQRSAIVDSIKSLYLKAISIFKSCLRNCPCKFYSKYIFSRKKYSTYFIFSACTKLTMVHIPINGNLWATYLAHLRDKSASIFCLKTNYPKIVFLLTWKYLLKSK